MRILLIALLLSLAACNPSIYTKDGVTDGDTFYLAPHAWADDDPVLQSWVAYSLLRSACQLELGGDNPARNHDYGCVRNTPASRMPISTACCACVARGTSMSTR